MRITLQRPPAQSLSRACFIQIFMPTEICVLTFCRIDGLQPTILPPSSRPFSPFSMIRIRVRRPMDRRHPYSEKICATIQSVCVRQWRPPGSTDSQHLPFASSIRVWCHWRLCLWVWSRSLFLNSNLYNSPVFDSSLFYLSENFIYRCLFRKSHKSGLWRRWPINGLLSTVAIDWLEKRSPLITMD